MSTFRRTLPLTLLLTSLLLTFAPSGLTALVEHVAWRVVTPPVSAATDTARETRGVIDIIRSIRSLRSENEDLKAENLRLKAELAARSEVQHENELLRAELGLQTAERERFELIPAKIIGRTPSTFLQFVVINRGSKDGLTEGLAATSGGYFIGYITDLSATTAKIQLITASRSRLPILLSQSRDVGLLRGGLSGLTGEEFQRETPIEPGEGVVTSGLGELIPENLPVGNVERRLSEESEFVERVAIHSPVEFSKLELVVILRPKS